MLASSAIVAKVVRTLHAAYGRDADKAADESYEAFRIALEPYMDSEVESGLIAALRERREFIPPPGVVAAHAKDARDSRYRAAEVVDDRRLICSTCQDRGSVIVVNRDWLAEHRDKFEEDWFVAGWKREAEIWCRDNGRKVGGLSGRRAFHWMACCDCNSPAAKMYRQQALSYLDAVHRGEVDKKKTPAPAFGLMVKSSDCILECECDELMQEAILEWTVRDRKDRTWSGNWTP